MNPPGAIMIMAGGTGGHIFPGLAVAEELTALGVAVIWLGSRHGLENRWVPAQGIALTTLNVSGLRGKGLQRLVVAPFSVLRALFQAIGVMRRARPRCVLSLGGFAAGPGGLAAWLLRYPLVVHEQNRVPGLTNRVLARLARRVLVGFEGAFGRRSSEPLGNPVRASMTGFASPEQRWASRREGARLLVLGGSQGAQTLNRVLPEALAMIDVARRPQIWHQFGQGHSDSGQAAYAALGVQVRGDAFIADMDRAYEWADLVVCRAGALTLAELCAVGIGAILIPYPHAVDDHQTRNAEVLVAAGAAELIPEARLSADSLVAKLIVILGDRRRLLGMATAARSLARLHAARDVARVCIEVGGVR